MLLLLTPVQTTFDKAITILKKAMNSNPRDIADLEESIDECQSLKITYPSLREAEQLLSQLEVPLLPVMYRCYSSLPGGVVIVTSRSLKRGEAET